MKGPDLKRARLEAGWSQGEAASRLGVSQSYFSMLETGERHLTPSLARRARNVFRLPPTTLPLPESLETRLGDNASQKLAENLAALGYEGFSYLRNRKHKKNPGVVLLTALAQDDLEARVVEGLPWLLVRYPGVDTQWLVDQAKLNNLQNRLGFVTALARQVVERRQQPDNSHSQSLAQLESTLERSRLAREDTLCKAAMSPREKQWLKANLSNEAQQWGLLTDWKAEFLPYAS